MTATARIAQCFEPLRTAGSGVWRRLLCWDHERDGPAVLLYPEDPADEWVAGAQRAATVGPHPHLLGVLSCFIDEDEVYAQTDDLWDTQPIGRLDALGAARVLLAVARAMSHARRRVPRLAHGGLTAENLHVDAEGTVRLRGLGFDHGPCPPSARPPELWRGEAPDARSDLYTLACTLVELLSGQPAVEGADAERQRVNHLSGRAAVPSTLAAPLADLLARCLRGRVADRLPGWDALERRAAQAVEGLGRTPPPLSELGAPPPLPVTATLWLAAGEALAQEHPARALPVLQTARRRAQGGDAPALLARAEVGLAAVLLDEGEPDEAQRVLTLGLPRAREHAPAHLAHAQLTMGRLLRGRGALDQAEAQLAAAAGSGSGSVAARARLGLAQLAHARGERSLAEALVEDAFEELVSDDLRAEAALLRAQLTLASGDDASEAFAEASSLASQAGRDELAEQAEDARLDSLLVSGRASEALPLLQERLASARSRGDAMEEAQGHERIARVLERLGEPERAARSYSSAASAFQVLGRTGHFVHSLCRAAAAHALAGQQPQALAVLQTAWTHAEREDRPAVLTQVEELLGDAAPLWLEQALDAALTADAPVDVAQLAGLLGRHHQVLGRTGQARALLQRALAAARHTGEAHLRLDALTQLASLLLELDADTIAAPLLEEALVDAHALRARARGEEVLEALARCHLAAGEEQAALDRWRQRLDSSRERADEDPSATAVAAHSAMEIAELLADAGASDQAADYARWVLQVDDGEWARAARAMLDG